MRTIAILPVKSFPAAKRRLSPRVGAAERRALARAMFADVLASLRRVRGLEAVAVVTADVVAGAAARRRGAVVIRDPAEAGQSAAAELGIGYARSAGFERVLLVPGDTPLLDPSEVEDLLHRGAVDRPELAIVPDRHGTGTNALLIAPPGGFAPSFGPGSLERHVGAARAAGLDHRIEITPSLSLDVDVGEDVVELEGVLAERPGAAASTSAALRSLGNLGAPASAPPAELADQLR